MSDKIKGCGDSLCIIEKPKGMATNGGCRCRPYKFAQKIRDLTKRNEELMVEIHKGDTLNMSRMAIIYDTEDERDRYRVAMREALGMLDPQHDTDVRSVISKALDNNEKEAL